ncbi:hypothetical protein CN679_01395 [Bacillus pseudomycoides]|uniref:helix-turn-helix domain-containing protein n=1 Tax=Bacillus pseudomycoides TaxID=64104 RepID=UPI000BEF29B2|nr:helix-turn-helix domain-containing protein [Bacillus pseudomycoides]PEI96418.1 hypothetical protein CN679_01395 [Bacillus pseudomycoides]
MKVYTVKEMATALGKHEETIKRWLRSGKFPNAFRNSDKQRWKIPESDFVHIKQGIGFVKEDSQKSRGSGEIHVSPLPLLVYCAEFVRFLTIRT